MLQYGAQADDLSIFDQRLLLINYWMSIIASILGIVTWIVIPKWRTLKSYIFLVLTFIYCLQYQKLIVANDALMYLWNQIREVLLSAMCVWLLILAFILYSELVNVFRSSLSILECNIIAWGLPIFGEILKAVVKLVSNNKSGLYVFLVLKSIFSCATFTCNFIIFFRMCYLACRRQKLNGHSVGRCLHFLVATLVFLYTETGLCILITMQSVFLVHHFCDPDEDAFDSYYQIFLGVSRLYLMQAISINSFVFMMGGKAWHQFLKDRKKNSVNHSPVDP